MIFIKRYACLLLASLWLAGCQFMPAQETGESADADTPAGETAEPTIIRLPNPYLEDRPSVPSAARERFASAQEALQQQAWAIAETDLLWLTENYPQFSGPYLNLALLYVDTGQLEEADTHFQQAIAANPNNINAYNEYGIFLREQGRFAEAESIYLQALKVWPDSPETLINLGILYDLYMGKFEQALEQYRTYQALQDEPERKVQGWIVDIERRQATN